MIKKLIIFLCLTASIAVAQDYPAKPSNYITDAAEVLNTEEEEELNVRLRSFEDSTTNQLFVYIANSLNGRDMQELSQEIFHNWHIGQKDKNNGVLIAVFIDDHKFRIHTGYGMEGVLPDLLTKHIQDEFMRPYFKEGDYYKGISEGIKKIIYYSSHEYVPAEKPPVTSYWQSWLIGYGANLLFLLLYIRNITRKKALSKKQKKKQKKSLGTVGKTLLILIAVIIAILPCVGAIILFFMFIFTSNVSLSGGGGSSSGSSSWSSSDSSWSSSDSSSSFDGGGGGDSGGGGSSSDW